MPPLFVNELIFGTGYYHIRKVIQLNRGSYTPKILRITHMNASCQNQCNLDKGPVYWQVKKRVIYSSLRNL